MAKGAWRWQSGPAPGSPAPAVPGPVGVGHRAGQLLAAQVDREGAARRGGGGVVADGDVEAGAASRRTGQRTVWSGRVQRWTQASRTLPAPKASPGAIWASKARRSSGCTSGASRRTGSTTGSPVELQGDDRVVAGRAPAAGSCDHQVARAGARHGQPRRRRSASKRARFTGGLQARHHQRGRMPPASAARAGKAEVRGARRPGGFAPGLHRQAGCAGCRRSKPGSPSSRRQAVQDADVPGIDAAVAHRARRSAARCRRGPRPWPAADEVAGRLVRGVQPVPAVGLVGGGDGLPVALAGRELGRAVGGRGVVAEARRAGRPASLARCAR